MKKEEITSLAQVLSAMKDSLEKLEQAKKKKNLEKFNSAKKEILNFQKNIDEII